VVRWCGGAVAFGSPPHHLTTSYPHHLTSIASPGFAQYPLPVGESLSNRSEIRAIYPEAVVAASVIETRDLRKTYGRIEALKGVSIRVNKGEIYGLLGQNGAGKTTLIKILLGIVKKTNGEAELLSHKAGDVNARKRVGYLPEDHQVPGYHSGFSLMDFYGALYGVPAAERRKKIPETLELVGIAGRMHSKIRTYSKGMKQRLGIAQALLHDPDLIMLDEPTDGVDPLGRREIRELMQRLKERGHTIFLNSHLLGEVELICDRVAILQQGNLIREGTIAELTRQKGRYEIGLAEGQEFPADAILKLGYAVIPLPDKPNLYDVTLMDERQTIDPVVRLIAEKGLGLRHLVEKKQTLEDAFLATVEGAEPGVDRRKRKIHAVGGKDR
jgi:ABC-2 type transport system ATP-binding protein